MLWIFEIKSVKEILIWILTVTILYSLKIEEFESDKFKFWLPRVNVRVYKKITSKGNKTYSPGGSRDCVIYEMRENKRAHWIATSVRSNKLTVTTKHFWGKKHLRGKSQILTYMQIASAKSRSAREHLTSQFSWVCAYESHVYALSI